MADAHKNFAYSTIATAPDPPKYATTIVVSAGQGALFPTPPFNATIWPTGEQPAANNAEIVRVTAISTDTFTISRGQENTINRYIQVGDQIAATITNQVMSEAEGTKQTWSPYILGSGAATGLQTQASATNQTGTGSIFVFPVTVPQIVRFNQIVMANSFSIITSNATVSNSYYSLFGLYTMNANTLSLISSNSFSIGETLRTGSATWNYPTDTATTGYSYGGLPYGNVTATQYLASALTGTRMIGLQFGGDLKIDPDIYYIGILSLRSTGNANNFGLSNAGIIGQVINPINQPGSSVSGSVLLPMGLAASEWTNSNSNITGWWGRHVVGFLTATSVTNYLGTAIPPAITLSQMGAIAANSTASILPSVTLVST